MFQVLFIIYLGMLAGLSATEAYGQTFEDGYQTYMRNQYPVAELQFKAALKKAKTKEDMAFILKFIGICQYMRGDKKQAGTSFYQAVGYDRGLTVEESEVLDPGVLSFFESIKARWAKDQQHAAAMPPKPQPAPAASPNPAPPTPTPTPAPTPAPAAQAAQAKTAAKPAQSSAKAPSKVALKAKPKPLGSAHASEINHSDGSSFSFFHLLPFGGGQFYNQSYLLGSTFALIEAYGLYSYLNLQKKIKDRQSIEASVTADERFTPEQISTFVTENGQYIDDLKKDQSLSLALFLGTWAIGIGEAVWNAPTPSSGTSASQSSKIPPSPSPFRWAAGWSPAARGQWQVHMQIALP